MSSRLDPVYCHDGEPHDWQRDPDRRGYGLMCTQCTQCGLTVAELEGITEAEMEEGW